MKAKAELFIKLEKIFDFDFEVPGQLESQLDRWCIVAFFDGNDRLAGNADFFGQIFLSYLSLLPLNSDAVG